MPKNTYFIKENYKKVEEVREIKSEIPSYEEFLKNYRADQEVSNSYENEMENYSDIRVSKGFGPCSICYRPTYWVNLSIPCPVEGCNNIVSTHTSGCGGSLEMSNKARIRCKSCGVDKSVKDFALGCSTHGYCRTMTENSFQKFLSLSLMMGDYSEVLRELNVYITEHIRW